ncbi:MAG: penicillin-binding transpeptidase domain-containing protein, partial [Verrucomicrobia bacterium]|nr:penicillin-binding transpeptidase domain-containing protein [Verrucomicrobiota bacterium]
MPASESNLAESSGSLLEAHKGYDPRIVAFYFVLAALLLTLVGGLAYRQLIQSETYSERERLQSQRRVLVPGPRGNIYARDGVTVLVGNRPHFSVVLYLAELKSEFIREADLIRRNYRQSGITNVSASTYAKIARVSVVQRYLDQVGKILGRTEAVDDRSLARHFNEQLLLPYTLIDDLTENEFARLLENLPVRSPLQVYTSSARYYPYGSAAAHALGYIRIKEEAVPEDFPGEDLQTFKMTGLVGKQGLEESFDELLQGEPGGTVIRVDNAGYKINPPLEKRLPVQGKNIVSSLDIDLQLAAEHAIGDQVGAAVAIDISTGEVLTLVSKPDYDLAEFSPRVSAAKYAEIQAQGAEYPRATMGLYPPGSTFKILTSIAAFRRGKITPDDPIIDCDGALQRYGHTFVCDNRRGHHHEVLVRQAIAESCDIYFNEAGWRTTAEGIAEEARRFHFGLRTGIELPSEMKGLVPDGAWKERTQHEKWFPGDTANMSIGQGFVLVTPLQMACFTASVARGEVYTKPTLLHDPNRPPQHTEPIGLSPDQRAAIFEGMEACTHPPKGTARFLTITEGVKLPGLRIAGKTGTA